MNIITLLTLSAGLAMDAFAVSVCKGLAMKKVTFRQMGLVGLWFGGFQGLMPLIGYFLGAQFADRIQSVDHWIAFALLGLIGAGMIKESFGEEETADASLDVKTMFLLAVATSIDALAIGVTFAFLEVSIVQACFMIGGVTFALSGAGVQIGNIFGVKYKSRAELAGGVILILLGMKILLEHLGILSII